MSEAFNDLDMALRGKVFLEKRSVHQHEMTENLFIFFWKYIKKMNDELNEYKERNIIKAEF